MTRQLQSFLRAAHRAYSEFLTIPSLVILSFVVLAVVLSDLNWSQFAWLGPVRHFMETHVFRDRTATTNLLTTIAAGIITVTSITFSLLLLAVQQSAASLTSQVFDQFLRRKLNQFYLGFFVGLALYALLILATIHAHNNAVVPSTVALLLTLVALYILVLLLYNTINQIRPVRIMESIHDLTVGARSTQMALVRGTRRQSRCSAPVCSSWKSPGYGYLTNINLDKLKKALRGCDGAEVEVLASMGAFLPTGREVALVRAQSDRDASALTEVVKKSLQIQPTRDIRGDPGYGIQELVTIAWTSASTAKQNLVPGRLTIDLLRDLLDQWLDAGNGEDDLAPVVYHDDVMLTLLNAFEELGAISSMSLQYQIFQQVIDSLASSFDRLPHDLQDRARDIVLLLLSVMGDHVLTEGLRCALTNLAAGLRRAGDERTAERVEEATAQLGRSLGRLNSRSTRAQSGR